MKHPNAFWLSIGTGLTCVTLFLAVARAWPVMAICAIIIGAPTVALAHLVVQARIPSDS